MQNENMVPESKGIAQSKLLGEPATTQETSEGVAKYMDRAAKEMKHSFRVFKHSRDAITYIYIYIYMRQYVYR